MKPHDGPDQRSAPTPVTQESGGGLTTPEQGAGDHHPGSRRAGLGPSTRTWAWVGFSLVCLVVIAVFVLENLGSVPVSFFGAQWRAPLAVDLILAAVLGGLIVFGFGSVRIVQLRRAVRRHRRAAQDALRSGDQAGQSIGAARSTRGRRHRGDR
ncbi:MAG: LapA family protein [Acidimicrobiales bacterium]